MKTALTSNNKDNIAISILIAASLFALACGLFNSNQAVAQQTVAVQKFDTIAVTAFRAPDAILDTIVVAASRKINRA